MTAAREWSRVGDAEHRLLLRDAVRQSCVVLPAVVAREEDVTPLALAVLTSQDWVSIDGAAVTRQRLTAVARELFWLLDGLDAESAGVPLAGVPPLRMWVLRNGFSGAYNRGSYLMWVGGGLGVPVDLPGRQVGLRGRLSRRCPAGPDRRRAGCRTSRTARRVRGPGSASPTVPLPRR